jgi:predicted adenylyl cyclase CyaB
MARNVEVKARIKSVDALLPIAAAIADHGPTEIFQDDTFFPCARGRLKLRAFSDTEGELIFYQRADSAGPKESFYIVSPATSPNTLREALSRAYGEAGRVRKHRTLFLTGKTRIHLDRVENLGHFLEIEFVLAQNEPIETGVSIANALLTQFGISPQYLVNEAYIDLLSRARVEPAS